MSQPYQHPACDRVSTTWSQCSTSPHIHTWSPDIVDESKDERLCNNHWQEVHEEKRRQSLDRFTALWNDSFRQMGMR